MMTKLKNIIILEYSSKKAYHVSESRYRNSIKKYGLDPKKYPGEITTDGNNVYIFLDYSEAVSYAKGYNDFLIRQGENKKYFDIWEIDITSMKLKKDYTLYGDEYDEDSSAYYISGTINPKKLKLITTLK